MCVVFVCVCSISERRGVVSCKNHLGRWTKVTWFFLETPMGLYTNCASHEDNNQEQTIPPTQPFVDTRSSYGIHFSPPKKQRESIGTNQTKRRCAVFCERAGCCGGRRSVVPHKKVEQTTSTLHGSVITHTPLSSSKAVPLPKKRLQNTSASTACNVVVSMMMMIRKVALLLLDPFIQKASTLSCKQINAPECNQLLGPFLSLSQRNFLLAGLSQNWP